MSNQDNDPLFSEDLFLKEMSISPLTVGFDFVEAVKEFGEDKAFELLRMLKEMF